MRRLPAVQPDSVTRGVRRHALNRATLFGLPARGTGSSKKWRRFGEVTSESERDLVGFCGSEEEAHVQQAQWCRRCIQQGM